MLATGVLLTESGVAEAMEAARAGMSAQLEAFAANTMDYLQRERALLLDGVGVPDVRTRIDGRPVLVVVRGYSYKEIAGRLHLSVKTIETHVSAVLRKLQLSNRHQLTAWANERRLI